MYNMHYSQMMHLYNGTFNPNPSQNIPYPPFPPATQPTPPQNFSHANIANFGSSSQPQPFYGQTAPAQNSGINFQAYPGWTGPSQAPS